MNDDVANRWLTRKDVQWKTISYSQNFEDVLIDRAFGRDHAGFYVDVGANDPVFHSVTKLLYERGWRGVNIEPTPSLHRRLVADRPGDACLNVGISDAEGTLTFHEVAPPLHGWSTFHPDLAASHRHEHGLAPVERAIPVTTLTRVFEGHVGDRTVDVLKVDAEGFERPVLAGLDWARWRPRLVLVESAWCDLWEPIVLGAGYLAAAFDGLNRYYVRTEDRALLPAFEAPVNVLDNAISHEVVRLLESQDEHFGPIVLALARRLRDASRAHPRLAALAKRLLRRGGGLPEGWRADAQSPGRRSSASPKRSTRTSIRSISER